VGLWWRAVSSMKRNGRLKWFVACLAAGCVTAVVCFAVNLIGNTDFVPSESVVIPELRIAGGQFHGIWGNMDRTTFVFCYDELPETFEFGAWERSLSGVGFSRQAGSGEKEPVVRRVVRDGRWIEEVRFRRFNPRSVTVMYVSRPVGANDRTLRDAGYGAWIDSVASQRLADRRRDGSPD
jgi:hypothetical protein